MGGFPGNELDRFSWRLLENAGIKSEFQLCKMGPEDVYIRVLKAQDACSLEFYYNLFGYLIDADPKELARDKEIRRRLQTRLWQEGLIKK